jgi:hypothetical protein
MSGINRRVISANGSHPCFQTMGFREDPYIQTDGGKTLEHHAHKTLLEIHITSRFRTAKAPYLVVLIDSSGS